MKIIEIPEDDLRAIHSRLDVQAKIIASIIGYSVNNIGFDQAMTLLKMLEESQNPFEVSDEQN